MEEEDYWRNAFIEAEKDKDVLKQSIRRLNECIVDLERLSVALSIVACLLSSILSQWNNWLGIVGCFLVGITWVWYRLASWI